MRTGDFNTPELTRTGFLDGQGLAMIVGRCRRTMTATVGQFRPLAEDQVLLVGARNQAPAERAALDASGIRWLPQAPARDADAVAAALDDLAGRVDAVHVHVDLDVHDPDAVAPANGFAARDGLLADDVQRLVRQAADRMPIVAATLAAYDPAYDDTGRMRETALDLLELLAAVGTCGSG
jgi:arginase